jgi:hypothetical protein
MPDTPELFFRRINMTQNNDVTSTNGAPKEYWEARARNEREQAEYLAYQRNAPKRAIKVILGTIGVIIFLVCILSFIGHRLFYQ